MKVNPRNNFCTNFSVCIFCSCFWWVINNFYKVRWEHSLFTIVYTFPPTFFFLLINQTHRWGINYFLRRKNYTERVEKFWCPYMSNMCTLSYIPISPYVKLVFSWGIYEGYTKNGRQIFWRNIQSHFHCDKTRCRKQFQLFSKA